MKKIIKLAVIFALCFPGTACKKNDGGSPVPVTPTDTVATGWVKIDNSQYYGVAYGGDIFFSNSLTGFCSDNNVNLLKTTDGGSNWSMFATLQCANMAMTGNGNAYFISLDKDSVYKLVNSALPFIAVHPPGADSLGDIFFSDNNNGLLSSATGLYKTNDAGVSWEQIPSVSSRPYGSIFMYNSQTAWLCYRNKIWHCNGDINNWQMDSIPSTDIYLGLLGLYAVSPSTVFVASATGNLYKSVDGGDNFSLLRTFENSGSNDLHFVDQNTGYFANGNRLYKTTDGGNSWSILIGLASSYFIEVHFTDPAHGWAITANGKVFKTN